MTVISSSKGSEKIIVDSYVEWDKNCYLALNAKDDFSDIPNNTFTDGKIIEFKKLENGNAEITLDKPLTSKIMEGTKIRVHGQGGSNLYTGIKTLQPGEEQVFTAARKKDNDVLEFSSNILPRGTYYATPMVLSYSVDPNKDNTILIKDYVISY